MFVRRIVSILLLIIGITAFLFGSYISDQVLQGQNKIDNTQNSVNQVRKFTRIIPYTKTIGKIATARIQQRIEEGKETVSQYQKMAYWLHIGGGISFLLGAILLIFSFSNKQRRRK